MTYIRENLIRLNSSDKIRYLIIGAITYFIDISTTLLLTMPFNVQVSLAAIIAFLISTIFSYIYSVNYVFKESEGYQKKTAILFFFTTVLGLFVNKLMLDVLTSSFGVHFLISKNIAIVFIILSNYFVRKNFIFKNIN